VTNPVTNAVTNLPLVTCSCKVVAAESGGDETCRGLLRVVTEDVDDEVARAARTEDADLVDGATGPDLGREVVGHDPAHTGVDVRRRRLSRSESYAGGFGKVLAKDASLGSSAEANPAAARRSPPWSETWGQAFW
jgi:hypothetical protein